MLWWNWMYDFVGGNPTPTNASSTSRRRRPESNNVHHDRTDTCRDRRRHATTCRSRSSTSYSTQTNTTLPSNLFTYTVQAPFIVSLNPQTGATGNELTLREPTSSQAQPSASAQSPTTTSPTLPVQRDGDSGTVVSARPAITATQIDRQRPHNGGGHLLPNRHLALAKYSGTPSSQPYNQPADIFTHT